MEFISANFPRLKMIAIIISNKEYLFWKHFYFIFIFKKLVWTNISLYDEICDFYLV